MDACEDGQIRKPLPGRHTGISVGVFVCRARPQVAVARAGLALVRARFGRKPMVPREGLEPPCLSATDFESAASTIPPPGHGVHKRGHVLAFWSPSVHPFAAPGTPLNSPHERSRPR